MMRVGLLLVCLFVLRVASHAQNDSTKTLAPLTSRAYDHYLSIPDTAIILARKALVLARQSESIYYEGYCYLILSKANWVKANYRLSTEYGFKAVKIFEDLPHYNELAISLLSLARTLVELGNLNKAHDLIHQALELGVRHRDERVEASAYREHSYLLTELNDLDSALVYADKGIALFEKLGDSLDVSILYGRKSRIYFQQRKYKKSLDYAYRGLMLDSLVHNRRALAISYYQVAQNEHALGNPETAIVHLKHSVRINSEIGNLNWQIKAHELLSNFYMEKKEYALAARELQKVSQFKDVLYNSEKNGQIQEMQSLHELEAKEDKIQLLERENTLKQQVVRNQRLFVAFLLVAVLFLVLLVFVLTRLRKMQSKTNDDLAIKNAAIQQQKIAIQHQAENLKQLDEVKTKLFSVISHDLRGPISNLQALLDMFTRKLMTAEEFITVSSKLKENLNHTQRTLENLLNWSLSQMGGIKTERKKIDVTACLNEACLLLEEAAARKNVTLKKSFDEELTVLADANQLQVILRNLIHNAIKFSAYNNQIHITAERRNSHCQITVKDYGIGMTPEELKALTSTGRYFSKSGTEQEKGTGLGLLLCKEFIARNGGEIFINSRPGIGTEVSFTLQLAEADLELAGRSN